MESTSVDKSRHDVHKFIKSIKSLQLYSLICSLLRSRLMRDITTIRRQPLPQKFLISAMITLYFAEVESSSNHISGYHRNEIC